MTALHFRDVGPTAARHLDRDEAVGDPGAGELRAATAPVALPRAWSAVDLLHATFPPIQWVVADFIPAGLSMLAGKPKLGKSWLMLDVAIAVARGGFALDRKCVQGAVLYAALEDNPRRLKGRLRKVCGSDAWPERLTFWTEMLPLEDGGLDQLRAWIAGAEGPRLVVIDVFSKVRRQKSAGEGIYDADYLAAAPLKALADETGVAVVIVHHLRKAAADDDPFDAVSGSTGLTGAMDTVLVLSRAAEGVTLYGRGRDIEEVEMAVKFDRETCRWSVLGDATDVRRSDERKDVLAELAQEDGLTPNDLAGRLGKRPGTVKVLLHRMAKAGEVARGERKGTYRHPDRVTPSKPCNPSNPVTRDREADDE
jgi:hypothetical protein